MESRPLDPGSHSSWGQGLPAYFKHLPRARTTASHPGPTGGGFWNLPSITTKKNTAAPCHPAITPGQARSQHDSSCVDSSSPHSSPWGEQVWRPVLQVRKPRASEVEQPAPGRAALSCVDSEFVFSGCPRGPRRSQRAKLAAGGSGRNCEEDKAGATERMGVSPVPAHLGPRIGQRQGWGRAPCSEVPAAGEWGAWGDARSLTCRALTWCSAWRWRRRRRRTWPPWVSLQAPRPEG